MHGALNRRDLLGVCAGVILAQSCGSSDRLERAWKWQRLPDLPLALAGQYAGVHNGALIVAGGSHSPVSKWAGGVKVWVDSVYVLAGPDAEWKRFSLPRPLGYGGSVSHERGLLLIGGGDADQNTADCHWLRWTDSEITVERGPALPVPLANCGAALAGDRAYVAGGQQSPTAVAAGRGLYSLRLGDARARWHKEADLPGAGRILPSVASAGGHLYVAGGADLAADSNGTPARRYLADAWRFSPGRGWAQLADLPEPCCAAPAFGVDEAVIILGGSDGLLAPREAELRDDHPGFSRTAKIHQPGRESTWRVVEQLPFSLVTTMATVWADRVVIPGGEDRPAHRSAAVYAVAQRELRART